MKTSLGSFLILLAAGALPLGAQSLTAGPEIEVARAGFIQYNALIPAVTVGPDGGFLASWHDFGTSVRGFSPADVPLGDLRMLSWNFRARIAPLGPGRYVAVWSDGSLRAQLLDAAGAPAGAPLELARSAGDPAVAAAPSGGFVVAWAHIGGLGDPPTVHRARRFDGQGQPVGEEVTLGPLDGIGALAALPDGGLAVAWSTLVAEEGGPARVHVRAFRADGSPAGPQTTVSAEGSSAQSATRIAADAAGRFVVAWTEYPVGEDTYRVWARRFSPAGEPLGPEILAGEETGRIAHLGDVAVRPEGSFLVAWETTSSVTGGPAHVPPNELPMGGDVLARAFNAAGGPLGPAFLVPLDMRKEQHGGDAEATPDGWIVSWKLRLDPQAGVYARRFTLSCDGAGTALCLHGGRFRAEVAWRLPTGQSGAGTPIPRTNDTGAFWFFAPENFELLVKVLDGRGTNGKFWVFYGSLTDVEFDLTVTDTATGQRRTYHNPAGSMASRSDTEAF